MGFWENLKKIFDIEPGTIMHAAVIVIILVAIFIIYDRGDDNSKIFSSITRCIRRFVALLADLASDIISIFSSLTEILNLIRILVFGKTDSQTQIFLANYAVIFMSVVSYFTTMTGFELVLGGWQAILASFGVQVGILVFSTRLSRLIANKYVIRKQTKYTYRFKENGCNEKCGNGQNSCSKVFIKRDTSKKNDGGEKIERNGKNGKKNRSELEEKKTFGWILTTIILIMLIMCSSFFSYSAFWEKFVLKNIPLNEYTDAQVSISEAEEEYSKSLKEYQQSLEDILYRVNSVILENLDVTYIRRLQIRQEKLKSELEEIEGRILDAENRISEFEEGSAEWNEIEDGELAGYREQRDKYEEDIEEIEDQLQSSNVYLTNETLQKLSNFYANPLNEDITLEQVGADWGDLQAVISQIDETKDLFTTEQKTNLNIILNNYLELCRYYRKNGTIGFKIKEPYWEDSLKAADNEEIEEADELNKKYNAETRRMLQNAIESFEETPNFAAVNSIWDENVIELPGRTRLLEKLYTVYREINGENTEKAIRSLGSLIRFWKPDRSAITRKNKGIVLFVLVLAVFIDLTIVFISVWKGNKTTNRSFSELRRLVGILFIKKKQKYDEEARRMQLSAAFGLLFGVLMFVLQKLIPSMEEAKNVKIYWFCFIYCAFGLLAGGIIGKAIGRTQRLVDPDEDEKEGQKETAGGATVNQNQDLRVIEEYLQPDFVKILSSIEMKTICVINLETHKVEKEKNVACLSVGQVQGWKTEFSMLESYKIVSISEDNNYYILRDIFWKVLYTNILNKMSGNIMLPMSVEDLMNYEDTDENNS